MIVDGRLYPTVEETVNEIDKRFKMPPRNIDEQTAYSLFYDGFYAGLFFAIERYEKLHERKTDENAPPVS